MTMTFNQAGGAVPANDSVVSEAEEEYARIGEMAKTFDVTLRTLRFYEDKGLLSPKRDGSTRLYTRRDRARLKLILLGRKIGFSLRDVKQIMDLYDPNGANTKQLRLTMEKSEKQLARLQKQRAAMDEAIAELSDMMATVRKMLADRTAPVAAAG
jgi:DNA-binding transcriptional MerR regulator